MHDELLTTMSEKNPSNFVYATCYFDNFPQIKVKYDCLTNSSEYLIDFDTL